MRRAGRRLPAGFPRLDRRHSLANELRVFVVPIGGNLFWEAVQGQIASRVGSASEAWGLGARGTVIRAKLASATSDYLSIAHHPSYNVVGDISILWAGQLTTGGAFRSFGSKTATNGASNNPFEFSTDNNAAPRPTLTRAQGGGIFRQYKMATGLTAGNYYHVGVGQSVAATIADYYINGVYDSSPGSGGGALTPVGDTSPLQVGRRQDGGTQMNGFTDLFAVWARRLTLEEFRALYENPYVLLLGARPVPMHAVASVGGHFVKIAGRSQRIAGNGGGLAA